MISPFILPLSWTDVASPDRRKDPKVTHGVPLVYRWQISPADVLTQSRSDLPPDEQNGEPEQHVLNPFSDSSAITLVNPAPPLARRDSQRTLPSRPDDGDQMINVEHPSGAHQWPNNLARTDGSPVRNGSRENVIGTEYLRHTDAGAVRVVELPPSYNELQF